VLLLIAVIIVVVERVLEPVLPPTRAYAPFSAKPSVAACHVFALAEAPQPTATDATAGIGRLHAARFLAARFLADCSEMGQFSKSLKDMRSILCGRTGPARLPRPPFAPKRPVHPRLLIH
jgi:hypothetical protein